MRHKAIKRIPGELIDVDPDPGTLYCYGHVNSLQDVSIDVLDRLIHLKRKHDIWKADDMPKLIDIIGDKFTVEHLTGRFVPNTDGEGYMNLIEYELGNEGPGVFKMTVITVEPETEAMAVEYRSRVETTQQQQSSEE